MDRIPKKRHGDELQDDRTRPPPQDFGGSEPHPFYRGPPVEKTAKLSPSEKEKKFEVIPESSDQETKKRHGDELQEDRTRPPPQDLGGSEQHPFYWGPPVEKTAKLTPSEKEKKFEVIPAEESSDQERQYAMNKTMEAVKIAWDALEDDRIQGKGDDGDDGDDDSEDSGPGRGMAYDTVDKGESKKKIDFPEYYEKFIRQLPNIPLVGFHLSSREKEGSTTCYCPFSPKLLHWKEQYLGGLNLIERYMPVCYSKKSNKQFKYSALRQHLKTSLTDSEHMNWHRIVLTYLNYLSPE
jgi:hypothetical protein